MKFVDTGNGLLNLDKVECVWMRKHICEDGEPPTKFSIVAKTSSETRAIFWTDNEDAALAYIGSIKDVLGDAFAGNLRDMTHKTLSWEQ